jgi:hypothetical protein
LLGREQIYKTAGLVFCDNEPEEVPRNCHLKERAEEGLKEAKEAAAWFNAPTVVSKCQETKPRGQRDEYHLLNRN